MWLIGKNIKIIKAKNKSLENLTGLVIKESKNSLLIETNKGEKMVLKNSLITLEVEGKTFKPDRKFLKRPEERI